MLSKRKRLQLKKQFSQAVENCNIQMISHIFDRGFYVNKIDNGKETYLHTAVDKDSEAMVRLLIWNGIDLNKQDKEGKTALHLACHKSLKVFNLLLHLGANVNLQDNQGLTPLHITCMRWKKSPERAIALLKKGANVEICCKNGQTPLHLAAEHNFGLVKVFLKKHVQLINSTDNRGYTPLHMACLFQSAVKIVLFLLEQGAEVNSLNNDWKTPLHIASSQLSVENVRALLNHGAEINAKCKVGQTPLHSASIQTYNTRIVDLLIEKGAHVNAQSKQGETPLHLAMQNKVELVQILLNNGADVNLKSYFNCNPYQESIYLGSMSALEGPLPGELRQIDKSRYALVNHIIKLKIAQLHVDVNISTEPYRKEYEDTTLNSLLELENIKLFSLNDKSLYTLLSNKRKKYLSTEFIENYETILNSHIFLELFPVYGHIMKNKFKSLMLMTRAVESFYSEVRSKQCIGLPVYITENILAYLSTEDLENFIKSE